MGERFISDELEGYLRWDPWRWPTRVEELSEST
jgi:hypothetical protein